MELENIGRTRLKLRLPGYRHVLSEMKSASMMEIFRAYAEAATQVDTLRCSEDPDRLLIEEYEKICLEIESSIEPYLTLFASKDGLKARR